MDSFTNYGSPPSPADPNISQNCTNQPQPCRTLQLVAFCNSLGICTAGPQMTWWMCMQAAHRRGGASGLYARSERRPSREESGRARHNRESSGRRPTLEQHGRVREGSRSQRSRHHSWLADVDGSGSIHVSASKNAQCGS
jgi:hypothetical protein